LVGGVDVYQHIRALLWTTLPAFSISLILFVVLALAQDVSPDTGQKQAALDAISGEYFISVINLLPLVLLVFLSIRRFPPFLSVLGGSLLAAIMAAFTQPDAVRSLAAEPDLGYVLASIKAIYTSMATGFVLNSGIEPVDALFSRGGMSSMLSTIWLILAALSFAAVMEHAGFLARLIEPVLKWADTTGKLISSVGGTAIGLNMVASDPYVADVLPARTFRLEFQRRGIQPQVLSRTIDDTATVTSPLIPWNSGGAYMSGTLGVSTFSYFPYCFLNLINPIISIAYGIVGFQVKRIVTPAPPDPSSEDSISIDVSSQQA
jgi:NhaC family Na+:H+ antiporter